MEIRYISDKTKYVAAMIAAVSILGLAGCGKVEDTTDEPDSTSIEYYDTTQQEDLFVAKDYQSQGLSEYEQALYDYTGGVVGGDKVVFDAPDEEEPIVDEVEIDEDYEEQSSSDYDFIVEDIHEVDLSNSIELEGMEELSDCLTINVGASASINGAIAEYFSELGIESEGYYIDNINDAGAELFFNVTNGERTFEFCFGWNTSTLYAREV